MRKILQLIFSSLILAYSTDIQAQDPAFSQFYAAPLQVNPAFAGNAIAPYIALNYRMTYPGFLDGQAAYSTFAASYDQAVARTKAGIGISLMTDDAGQGTWRKTYASVIYSYKVALTKDIAAKIGVEVGMIQSNLNWDKLFFLDQIDPILGPYLADGSRRPSQEQRPLETNRTLFDLSTGFLIYGSGFHLGVSGKHLATPNEGLLNINPELRVGLPIRWTLEGGYEIIVRKGNRRRPTTFVSPSVMYMRQGDFGQLMVGAYGGFGSVFTGVWYRQAQKSPESAIFMLGFRQEFFKVAYSYDIPVGSLLGRSGGSHEVSFTLNLDPKAGKKQDINDCFKMFR